MENDTDSAVSRMKAFGVKPDVYYAPNPKECILVYREVVRLREIVAKYEEAP